MTVTTYDPGAGTISATQDSGANAVNTIAIPAQGAGTRIRLWKISVDTSAAAAAADTTVVVKDDTGTVVWKRMLNATRGPQWSEEFYDSDGKSINGLLSRDNKALTVEAAAAGGTCVTTLNVLYDTKR